MLDLRKIFPGAWRPRSGARDGYPYDLDGSERITRFQTPPGPRPFIGGDGTVAQIGMVNGFLQQMDVLVWYQMTGKVPFGPFSTTQPLNLQMQVTVPGLTKMGRQ